MDQGSELAGQLDRALARHLHGRLVAGSLKPLTAGAASRTFACSADIDGQQVPLILQCAATEQTSDFVGGLAKRDLARLQSVLHEAGLPVARVRCALDTDDGLGDGYIMDRVDGETLAPRILRDEAFANARDVMASQCGQIAARVHAMDPAGLPPLNTKTAAAQLAELTVTYRRLAGALPVFELAIQWLEDHLPADRPTTLVHGDFRNGNFVVGPDGIRAVLDWELAHLGDPAEDLGWIAVNSWRFGRREKPVGGFGARADLLAGYEAAGGHGIDPGVVHFWELFGTFKWGVMCLFMADQHLSGAVRSVERAAIGRRVSETELDLLALLKEGL